MRFLFEWLFRNQLRIHVCSEKCVSRKPCIVHLISNSPTITIIIEGKIYDKPVRKKPKIVFMEQAIKGIRMITHSEV